MLKKRLLSLTLAALLACSALFGCAASEASSANPDSSSADSATEEADRGSDTIKVAVVFDIDAIKGTSEAELIAPYKGPLGYDLAEGATAYDALIATGVEVDGTPSYVTSINGVGEGLVGSESGWMYRVNDETPSVPAKEYVLEEGDIVVWYYGSWD